MHFEGLHNVVHLKGVLHIIVVLLVLFKVHIIDRKLNILEKRFLNK